MSLPNHIQIQIDAAISLIEEALQVRLQKKESTEDLDKLMGELKEMRSGLRNAPSAELNRMVVDGMDWDAPFMQKYFEVSDLVSRHFAAQRKKN